MRKSWKIAGTAVAAIVGLLVTAVSGYVYSQVMYPGASFVESLILMVGGSIPNTKNKLPPVIVEILEKADRFYVLSLDPNLIPSSREELEKRKQRESFYRYSVLKKVEVADKGKRASLLQTLYRGVEGNRGLVAACFEPGHGISAMFEGKTADLVICFKCLQVRIHGSVEGEVLVSQYPQRAFNQALSIP